MTDQSYQLLRIIIIDSFWKGQVNELDLSGHTQFEGTNGAGKTSLMRLLPLFYGMRPSEIVSKVDQALNFVDFYLPRDSSLLVYEYKRPYGQTCLVLAKSDGRGVHFKFIDGAYHSERFIGEDKKTFSINEVERLYRYDNRHCSGYLGADKYCQIIQNLRGGRKLKEVRDLQKQYSFCYTPMPHIDKVINGALEKNLDFDAVKRMLVGISSDKLARNTIGEKEHVSLKKDDISRWLADLQACRMIQKLSPKIVLWQDDFNTLDSWIVKLQHLYAHAISHQTLLNAQQAINKELKVSARKKINELSDEVEKTKGNLTAEINKLNTNIEANQSRIDSLATRKLKYEDQDAALFQIKADQAPNIQRQLDEVNEIIAAFNGNIARVTSKFEKLISALELQNLKDIAKNKDQMSQIKDSAHLELETINDTYQKQQDALNSQLDDSRLSLKLKLLNISNELEKCVAKQKDPILPKALIDSLEENQLLLQETQEMQNQFLKNLGSQEKTLYILEKQRDQWLDKRKQENSYLDKLNQQCVDIESLLLPINGSLHQFLANCEQAVGWKENIGRLLSTDQLNRIDLLPRWKTASAEHHDNIYGLQIEVEQLINSDLQLSKSQLSEKLNALDEKRDRQKQSIEHIDTQLGVFNKDITGQTESITIIKQELKQNELKLVQFTIQKRKLADQKQRATHELKTEIEVSIKKLNADNQYQQKKLIVLKESAPKQKSELNKVMLEQRIVIESDRDNKLDKLATLLNEIELSAKTRLNDHRQQKNKSLEEFDPDGEVDKRSKEALKLTSDLKECAGWANQAKEYRAFMETSYSKHDNLVEATQNKQMDLRSLQNNLDDFTESKKLEISQQTKNLKKMSEKIQHTEDLLFDFSSMLKECDHHGIAALTDKNEVNNDAELTISFCRDWLSNFTEIHKRLQKQINDFKDTFSKNHTHSELFENWEKLIIENNTFVGAKKIFKYQKPLQDLLSSAVQKQKNTYQLVTVNANIINEFYQHIENFGRTIKNIGKHLSKSVTSIANFEALADINVYTVMKQEELDYWGPLQQFAKLFEKHKDDLREGIGKIPDDLLYAMQKLSTYLPSEGFTLALESLFDIEFTITEKGQLKYARNARQLKKISSTGLSYLAMLSLFSGLLVMLRGSEGDNTNIILPVDELGELAAENIDLLLKMFSKHNISMLSAAPSTNRHILSLYDKYYQLKDNKIYHAKIQGSRLDKLMARRNKEIPPCEGVLSHV
ncbi:MAG: ATP-binding protein [Psychromonas sp.]|nr:ATP-binding protein [Psychromonas sp.]